MIASNAQKYSILSNNNRIKGPILKNSLARTMADRGNMTIETEKRENKRKQRIIAIAIVVCILAVISVIVIAVIMTAADPYPKATVKSNTTTPCPELDIFDNLEPCPEAKGWTYFEHTEMCYKMAANKVQWDQANRSCVAIKVHKTKILVHVLL